MVRDFSQKTVQELYETIRVNVDEEEQWKVFDFVEDFFMEELEIGDYINDINSYHLHMFDKHDVTTKKFDAIVEKAGKVDANYAAQIEGYCSLLGEYGKKFEAVCAMLQPEKLRLSPDKYREKLEGINTGYQNAKDTHEQEQSAYEAELYEIETVWYKKMLDKAEDYLIRSAECVVLGNFTDEVTVLGVGVQIVLGIFDLDLPCDIRDIIADIKNLAETDRVRWDLIGMLALDLIGLIPVIGALKYSDETAEAVASGEKLLKESQTVYESFADMMSPEDAKRYLDFLENGSREGLTSAELADALLVSRKVGYEDVWDLRNVGDALESGSKTINGLNIIDGKVDGKIPLAEYKKYRVDSVHNIDSDTMTLGKYEPTIRADGTKDFSIPGPGAYTVKAGDTTYFSLGTEWDKITDTYGLDVAGQNMFDYFNKPALDDAVNAGKEIRFSHNPEAYGECALKWEWDYLQEKHGYFALEKKGDFWYATK